MGVGLMPSERPDDTGKSVYLRAVPDQTGLGAHPDYGHSDRTGFANSTIDREAYIFGDRPNARDFDALLVTYMWSGGLARHQEAARRLEEAHAGSSSTVQRLLNSNAVFAFDWRGSLWLPMFQFQPLEMLVKPAPRRVLSELTGVFDGWSLAVWYLQQNSWLDNRRPIDLIDRHPSAVLTAARGDRFIATDSLQRVQ
jgi:hypothetical protein